MDTNDLVSLLAKLWSAAADVLSSTFMIAALSSAFGAGFGAWAAQRISERGKRRDELLREIRKTNAAMDLSFRIINFAYGLKRQFLKNLKEHYDASRSGYLEFLDQLKSGHPKQFTLEHKFHTFTAPLPRCDALEKILFNDLSLVGRPLHLFIVITDSICTLDDLIQRRLAFIDWYKKVCAAENKDCIPELYFGLPYKDKLTDVTYPKTLEGLCQTTDDCLQFSIFLIRDLQTHGQKLVDEFKRRFDKKDAPRLHHPTFSELYESGLMPNEEDYSDWTAKFKSSS